MSSSVFIDPDTPREEDAALFTLFVVHVVTDARGWRTGRALHITRRREKADIIVSLVDDEVLSERFRTLGRGDLKGMSATTMGRRPAQVWINARRWKQGPDRRVTVRDAQGVPITCDSLRLHVYRTYVLNHELGHALGLPHAPPRDGHCSIMTQQTKTLPGDCWFQAWPDRRQLTKLRQRQLANTTGS